MTVTRTAMAGSGRLAGDVLRWHTWPTFKQQTVAAHTWHLMRIYVELFGPPSPAATVSMLWHDGGEVIAGDVPFSAKLRWPALKKAVEVAERHALHDITGNLANDCYDQLTDDERRRIKLCDMLEFVEFAYHELLVGNKFMEPVILDGEIACGKLTHDTIDFEPVAKWLRRLHTRFC